MPNTVLDALPTGVPLLLSDIAPHEEILSKSVSEIGVLYNQKDVISLCNSIKKILTLKQKEVSSIAYVVFKKYYTAKIMSDKYQEEYKKLMINKYEQ